MSDIHTSDWSATASSNNATPPNGWPENMDFSKVNDTARENMAALKRWYNDISGVNTTGGTATAYTLAADRTIASYAAGQVFCFYVNAANTGSATLNVDSVGAKTIKKHHDVNLAPGDLETDQICVVAYKATEDVFQLLSPTAAEHYRNVNTLTAAPVVGDDVADGYQAGSLAVDVTGDRAYVCVDNSSGAAVWKKISGGVIQRVEATPYTTQASDSSTFPVDGSIPQLSEGGGPYLTAAITPTKSANRLVIECTMVLGSDSANTSVVALFQDSTANALAATVHSWEASGYVATVTLRHEMAAGTTSSTSFTIRLGSNSGSVYVNRSAGQATLLGGVLACRLSVTEIEA